MLISKSPAARKSAPHIRLYECFPLYDHAKYAILFYIKNAGENMATYENGNILNKEDYFEDCCRIGTVNAVQRIPIERIIEKLDTFLIKNDMQGAENHLNYWLRETQSQNDMRGMLSVLNESIGFYRKTGIEEKALDAAEKAIALAKKIGLAKSITMGTTLVNAATAYKAFDKCETALPLYEKAREIYEKELEPSDIRLGALYNNMALTVTSLGNYAEAKELYEKALCIMRNIRGCEGEVAVTYCNLADLAACEYGLLAGTDKINELLEKAKYFLDSESVPRDGNYAYICEKCSSVFGYYGFFAYEELLKERAKEIYERS